MWIRDQAQFCTQLTTFSILVCFLVYVYKGDIGWTVKWNCPLQDYQSCHEQSEEVILKDNLLNILHEVQPLVAVYACQVAWGGTDISSYVPLSVDIVHLVHTEHFFWDLSLNATSEGSKMHVVQAT